METKLNILIAIITIVMVFCFNWSEKIHFYLLIYLLIPHIILSNLIFVKNW